MSRVGDIQGVRAGAGGPHGHDVDKVVPEAERRGPEANPSHGRQGWPEEGAGPVCRRNRAVGYWFEDSFRYCSVWLVK